MISTKQMEVVHRTSRTSTTPGLSEDCDTLLRETRAGELAGATRSHPATGRHFGEVFDRRDRDRIEFANVGGPL